MKKNKQFAARYFKEKEKGEQGRFAAYHRIDLYLSIWNKRWSLITFFNFIPQKATLSIFVPEVPHGYHGKKYFFFWIKRF